MERALSYSNKWDYINGKYHTLSHPCIIYDSPIVKQDLYRSIFPINHFLNIKLKTPVPWKTSWEWRNSLRKISWEWSWTSHSSSANTENIQSSHPIVYKSHANPHTARLARSSNSYTCGIISQQTRNTEIQELSLLLLIFPLQIMLLLLYFLLHVLFFRWSWQFWGHAGSSVASWQ